MRLSEKTALGVIPGFAPLGHPSLDGQPRGGAGSARPTKKLGLDRGISPLGRGPSLTHVVEMECLGASSALPCGRGDRAPPRKSPFASFPGLPRKAILACIALPLEGRAPHARKGRHRGEHNITPSWPPASRKGTGGNAMPCHSSGRTTRTHRVRPSEKTDLYVIPGFSPKGLSATLAPAEGRPPHAR